MSNGSSLTGDLKFLNLGEVLQLLGANGSTGILSLMSKYAQNPGIIYLDSGNPVEASDGSLTGIDGLYALFGWTDGKFEFKEQDVNKKNTVKKSRMEIILEGLRMVDDGQVEILGAVSYKPKKSDDPEKSSHVPLIRGPLVDYMYVIDEEDFKDGDEIVKEGKHGGWIWVILDGTVDIIKETKKGKFNIIRIGEGSFVGSMSSFFSKSNVRSASAFAKGEVQLGMLDSQQLFSEFSNMSSDFKNIIKSLDKRLKLVSNRAFDFYLGKLNLDEIISGKPVMKQGDNENRLFSIAKGKASIVRNFEKTFIPLVDLGERDFIGNIPFFDMGHEPYSASVFASKDFKISKMDIAGLQKEYDNLSTTFQNLIENVATCITATTMVASEFYKKIKKKK